MSRLRSFAVGLVLCLSFLSGSVYAQPAPPEKITDGAVKYRMSRNSGGQLAVDGAGRLHLTYWSGGIVSTPDRPSAVYYRTWDPLFGLSGQEILDDSRVGSNRIGGRHPQLAITDDNAIRVVWHDYRHCTLTGNWIDNIEVYGDLKRPGRNFSSNDIRYTETSAGHIGDNSQVPRIAAHSDGKLSLVWYDFNADKDISDVFLFTSDNFGDFGLPRPIASGRLTDLTDRAGTPGYSLVDLAVDSAGTRSLVWVAGFGAGGDLYYAEAPAAHTGKVTEQVLAPGATDFFDPPHIEVGPNNDVWVAYGDDSVAGGEDVILLRKRADQPMFDAPINLTGAVGREYAPDLELDSEGKIHLVWVEENGGGTDVRYGIYDPGISGWEENVRLTETSAAWAHPSITVDENGFVYALWEESGGFNAGDLWFWTTAEYTPSGVENWELLE